MSAPHVDGAAPPSGRIFHASLIAGSMRSSYGGGGAGHSGHRLNRLIEGGQRFVVATMGVVALGDLAGDQRAVGLGGHSANGSVQAGTRQGVRFVRFVRFVGFVRFGTFEPVEPAEPVEPQPVEPATRSGVARRSRTARRRRRSAARSTASTRWSPQARSARTRPRRGGPSRSPHDVGRVSADVEADRTLLADFDRPASTVTWRNGELWSAIRDVAHDRLLQPEPRRAAEHAARRTCRRTATSIRIEGGWPFSLRKSASPAVAVKRARLVEEHRMRHRPAQD